MKRWLWALGGLVAMAACSEDELRPVDPTGSGAGSATTIVPSGDPIKDFCEAVTRPFCEAYFECCTESDRLEQHGGSVEGCIAHVDCEGSLRDPEDGLADELENGTTVLDYERLEACVARIDALLPGGSACTEPPLRAAHDCYGAFVGQIEPGGDCSGFDGDLSWIVCKDGFCDEGTCVPFLESGAACDNVDEPTSYCNIARWEACVDDGNGSPSCRPYQELGGTCIPAEPDGGSLGGPPDTTRQFQCQSYECVDNECVPPDVSGMCVGGG